MDRKVVGVVFFGFGVVAIVAVVTSPTTVAWCSAVVVAIVR